MTGPDRIELRQLRILGTHGVLPEERHRAQPFAVDLDLEVDLAPAGTSDDLADTVDYGGVVDRVVEVVGGPRSYQLLEALAEAIADQALLDDRVRSVTVSIRKLRPPLAADLASVGVRVTRRR
jgi:7,8-dihydroneopterin aldolase/epimerase/oxygenase